jgi:hypothetical protein
MQINLSLNPYLFGCGILFLWGLLVFAIVGTRGTARNRDEFWWGTLASIVLGFTKPLFVPEYWDPPSVLSYGRWDLESFLFCAVLGGERWERWPQRRITAFCYPSPPSNTAYRRPLLVKGGRGREA